MDPRATALVPARHQLIEGGLTAMTWTHDDDPPDPRHVFLNASDVLHRYGCGKTKGYQNLKDRELVPPPVMTHPNRWCLDQLLAWEERRMVMTDPDRRPETVTDLLPQPKRRRRSA